MQRLMKITPVFLVAYVLLMIPTYVLPIFGSNSSFATLVGGAVGGLGGAFPPQWWAHMFVLAVLVVVAWARGMSFVSKSYLPALAFLAALFDMVPFLRIIPLVPTLLHMLTLVLGIVGCVAKKEDEFPATVAVWRRPASVLAMCTVIAVVGTSWSVWSMTDRRSDEEKVAEMFFGVQGNGNKSKTPAKANTKADDEKVFNMFYGPSSKDNAKSEKAAPAPAPVVTEKPATAKTDVAVVKPAAPVAETAAPVVKAEPVAVAKVEPAPAVKAEPVSAAPAATPTADKAVNRVAEAKPAAADKPKKATSERKPVASANAAVVADFLSEGRTCMSAKRYDCAISQAKAALRLDGENATARKMLAQAKTEQREAMDAIEIR